MVDPTSAFNKPLSAVDPDALREALAYYEEGGADPNDPYTELVTILAAARELLRLMETAETVWWCEEHRMAALLGGQSYCAHKHYWPDGYPAPCRMVVAVLTRRDTEPQTETELDRNQMGIW